MTEDGNMSSPVGTPPTIKTGFSTGVFSAFCVEDVVSKAMVPVDPGELVDAVRTVPWGTDSCRLNAGGPVHS